MIVETDRLLIREMDAERDAAFVNELLNTPKFLKYIGDRSVRSEADAAIFISEKYRQSYHDHGYGLYTVELLLPRIPIGVCGFVRRDTLPGPDIGFAFLPEYEGQGYGMESAAAMLAYGRDTLGFTVVYAITSLDNEVSGRLLKKLGFRFDRVIELQDTEQLKVFEYNF